MAGSARRANEISSKRSEDLAMPIRPRSILMAVAFCGGALVAASPVAGPSVFRGEPGCFLAAIAQHITPQDAADRQPLDDRSGRFWLVADARLDGRPALCSALGLRAEERERLPDSVLIFHAFLRWGPACVAHLQGDFAFAIWDRRDDSGRVQVCNHRLSRSQIDADQATSSAVCHENTWF